MILRSWPCSLLPTCRSGWRIKWSGLGVGVSVMWFSSDVPRKHGPITKQDMNTTSSTHTCMFYVRRTFLSHRIKDMVSAFVLQQRIQFQVPYLIGRCQVSSHKTTSLVHLTLICNTIGVIFLDSGLYVSIFHKHGFWANFQHYSDGKIQNGGHWDQERKSQKYFSWFCQYLNLYIFASNIRLLQRSKVNTFCTMVSTVIDHISETKTQMISTTIFLGKK